MSFNVKQGLTSYLSRHLQCGTFVPMIAAGVGLICLICTARPLTAADPAQLLATAEHLADLYNWYDAHPLYAEAEAAFRDAGDQRNGLFAQASRLRGEMQIRAFPELLDAIDSILASSASLPSHKG
jgi:hypothetical protein